MLERGYALVEGAQGKLLRAAAEAPEGSDIRVRLAQGRLTARVTASEPA